MKPPKAHLLIAVLGLGLTLPSLGAGFFADDILHLLTLEGRLPEEFSARPLDLFRFLTGEPAAGERLIRMGVSPWWTDPQVRVAFFRPLSSLTHLLDHALWGTHPVGYHVTNLVLWLGVLLSASAVLRRLAPSPRAATLALLVFAVSDARGLVVSWVANRNALLSTLLVLLALCSWDDFRRGAGRSYALLAWLLITLGLLAGETALGGLALIAAYELFGLPHGPALDRRRLRWAWPLAVIGLIYVAVYKLGGFGVAHSGIYVDPATDAGAWLQVAATRFPALASALIWSWPIDYWVMGEGAERVLAVGGAILLAASVAVFWRVVRQQRALAAMALGGALALLPLTSTFPSTRLLLLPGLPAALLIGTYLDQAWPPRRAGWLRGAVAGLLGLRSIVLAPALLALNVALLSAAFRQTRAELLDIAWPDGIERRDVYLLNAPHWASATYLQPLLVLEGRAAPAAVHTLNLAPFPAVVLRPDAHSLRLNFRCGEMLTTTFEQLARNSPVPKGATVDAGAFTATVLEAGVRGPRAVQFQFPAPPDAAVFLRWNGATFEPVRLPEVGGALELPPVSVGLGSMRAPAPTCHDAAE